VEAEQGVLKLRAPKILVKSITDSKQISKIIASGGVILESAVETASSDNAIYDMVTGLIEMTGNVILKKGTTTIAGPKFIVDVNNGTGMMQGRVKSVFSASSQ
ncbi:MAG: LptA/OstA family protein, partial [Paracoccaceae bacterium]